MKKINNKYFVIVIIILGLFLYSFNIQNRYYNVNMWDHFGYWDVIKINTDSFYEYLKTILNDITIMYARPTLFLIYIPIHYLFFNNVSLLYFVLLFTGIIISILIYLILCKLNVNSFLSFIITIVYLLFPAKIYTLIAGIYSFVLFGILFFLLSIYLYIKYLKSERKVYKNIFFGLSLVFYALSINAVELAMSYIIVFIFLEWYYKKNSIKRALINISIIFIIIILSIYWKFVLYPAIFEIAYHKSTNFSISFLISRFYSQTLAFIDINFGWFFWRNYIVKGFYHLKDNTINKLLILIPSFIIIFETIRRNYIEKINNKQLLKYILFFLLLGWIGIFVFIPSGYVLQHYHNHLNALSAFGASATYILVIIYILNMIFSFKNFKYKKILWTFGLTFFITILISANLFIIERVNEQEIMLNDLKNNLKTILPDTEREKVIIMTNYPLWIDVGYRVEFLKWSFPHIIRSLQNNYVGYDINGIDNIREKVNTFDIDYIIFDYRRNKLFESVEFYEKVN